MTKRINEIKIIENNGEIILTKDFQFGHTSDGVTACVGTHEWKFTLEELNNYSENLNTYIKLYCVVYGNNEPRNYYECYHKGKFGARTVEEYKKYHTLEEDRADIEVLVDKIRSTVVK